MLERIRRVGADLVCLAGLRIELFGVELREQLAHWMRVCVLAVAAIALGCITLGFIAALITVALWETHRLAALSVFSALFLIAALWCARTLSALLATAPAPFAATITEFRKDRAALDPASGNDDTPDTDTEARVPPQGGDETGRHR